MMATSIHYPLKALVKRQRTSLRFYGSSKVPASKAPGGTTKRPKIHSQEANVETSWFSSKRPQSSSLDMGKYGLRRLDYATLETPVWTIPPHPPTKSVMERVLFPLTVAATGAIIVWAYMNPEEDDMTEYWKRVETGRILMEDDDDDDEDDDDWDDEED